MVDPLTLVRKVKLTFSVGLINSLTKFPAKTKLFHCDEKKSMLTYIKSPMVTNRFTLEEYPGSIPAFVIWWLGKKNSLNYSFLDAHCHVGIIKVQQYVSRLQSWIIRVEGSLNRITLLLSQQHECFAITLITYWDFVITLFASISVIAWWESLRVHSFNGSNTLCCTLMCYLG